jgi:hypothetical protein
MRAEAKTLLAEARAKELGTVRNLRQALHVARRMFDPDPECQNPHASQPATAASTISADKVLRRR